MPENSKQYNLEDRTYRFVCDCRDFVKQLTKILSNIEYGKHLIRSSGSQAANYIEANESLSKKDFVHRMKIYRKETKECSLWLKLLDTGGSQELMQKQQQLIQETTELRKIFNAIVEKSL